MNKKKCKHKAANIKFDTWESVSKNGGRHINIAKPWWAALNIYTNEHKHVQHNYQTREMENEVKQEQDQRMQAIKGVSMFYARSSRINSGIIQAEWMYSALFCVHLFQPAGTKMWFRFGLSLRQYHLSHRTCSIVFFMPIGNSSHGFVSVCIT